MPCYHLRTDDLEHSRNTIARDRSEAPLMLGEKLNCALSLDETEDGVAYLLDEWPEKSGPHWVNPTIPVYLAR
jgi:hypothetical protein